MPTKIALYVIYFRGYKKILNIKNPSTWGEKIQWLKINGGLEKLSKYVDKYEVREFIRDTIGEEYLNHLYGVYDCVDDIDFSILPDKFVLKCTNGSGSVIVCDNINSFDIEDAKKEMGRWLVDDYYKEKKELQYRDVKNRIIIEEYLEDSSKSLTDYKFYVFNGKVEYFAVFYDRYTNKSVDTFRVDGKKLENVKVCNIPNSNYEFEYDEKIKQMIRLSEILSRCFTFVRVDFYLVKGKIIFGELTFTDGAGSDPWNPISFDKEIGAKIPLCEILKEGRVL